MDIRFQLQTPITSAHSYIKCTLTIFSIYLYFHRMNKIKELDSNPLPVKVFDTYSVYTRLARQLLQIYYTVFTPPRPHCFGTFMEFGKFVWIHDQESIKELYLSGSFGKGDLSRSDPTWFTRTVEENKESLEEITVERRKKRRQKKLATSSTDIENSLTSKELLDLTNNKDLEHFQLDLYESFFLVYALNALSIKSRKQVWIDYCITQTMQLTRIYH